MSHHADCRSWLNDFRIHIAQRGNGEAREGLLWRKSVNMAESIANNTVNVVEELCFQYWLGIILVEIGFVLFIPSTPCAHTSASTSL